MYERRPGRLLKYAFVTAQCWQMIYTSCRPSCHPIVTCSATLLITASPLEVICTEISISPPGVLLS
eukprot:4948602-Pleurochrysis_carterae.AAC.1